MSHVESFLGDKAGLFPGRFWEGRALAAVRGDRVLGIGGARAEGTDAVVGMMLSDELRRKPVFLHKSVLRGIAALKALGFKRILASPETEVSARWMARLGFSRQGDTWIKWLA